MEEKVIELIRKYSNAKDITLDSNILIDLEMSSLELMSFFGDIEGVYNIKIKNRQLRNVETVGDIIDLIQSMTEE